MTSSRRFIVAAAALALAFTLFRGELATAIVTRADDALRAGDIAAALRFYDRAAQVDPRSGVAADRLAFYLALRHDRVSAQRAITVATRAIRNGASAPALFADRAFAAAQLHDWVDAQRDFERAAADAHDARYDHFAGRMALHAGDRAAAARDARQALADQPSFAPSRALARELR